MYERTNRIGMHRVSNQAIFGKIANRAGSKKCGKRHSSAIGRFVCWRPARMSARRALADGSGTIEWQRRRNSSRSSFQKPFP